MATRGIEPGVLREQLDSIGVDLSAGDTTGYVALDTKLNLNALAIGLGLENIAYEPEQFPGLFYHLDDSEATVVLFTNGVITTVDGASDQAVKDTITTVIERGEDLGLVDIDSTPSVSVEIEAIPIADELNTSE